MPTSQNRDMGPPDRRWLVGGNRPRWAPGLLGLSDAGFDDGCFLLLLVVVEDGHFVALDGELHLFAERYVGWFRPWKDELLADDVGFGVGLDGEDLIGVGVFGGEGGGVLGVVHVFGF